MNNGRDDKGRFTQGNSGGPGRPLKGEALTEVLRAKIDKDAIAAKLIEIALGGDVVALRYVYDRIDGKPIETVNQTVRKVPEYVGFADPDDTENTEAD